MDVASIARAWIDAYNSKDLETLVGMVADDFQWSDPDIGIELDRQAFVEASKAIAEQIPDRRIDLHEMVVLNDYAVAFSAAWRGTPVGDAISTGARLEPVGRDQLRASESMVVEVKDGRVRFVRVYR